MVWRHGVVEIVGSKAQGYDSLLEKIVDQCELRFRRISDYSVRSLRVKG